MLAKNNEKTKLAPKYLIIGFVLTLFGLSFMVVSKMQPQCDVTSASPSSDLCVNAEVVVTPQDRAVGLSKYESIADDQAMIFVYRKSQPICIWMKDMKFSIDILWLNEQKVITKVKENVSPQTYPKVFCDDNSRYVIELPAGKVKNTQTQIGQTIDFN